MEAWQIGHAGWRCASSKHRYVNVSDDWLATGEGTTEKISEFKVVIEPTTSVSPVGCCNHWAGDFSVPLTLRARQCDFQRKNWRNAARMSHDKTWMFSEDISDFVHKIPCGGCSWNYIGETGRSFATRKNPNLSGMWRQRLKALELPIMLGLRTMSLTSTMRRSSTKENFRIRKFLEFCHTSITPNADNKSCPLPGQYRIPFNKNSSSPFLSLISLYCLNFYLTIYFPNFHFIHLFARWRPQPSRRKLVIRNIFNKRTFKLYNVIFLAFERDRWNME